MINFTTLFKKDNSAEKLESVENTIKRFLHRYKDQKTIPSKITRKHLKNLLTIIQK